MIKSENKDTGNPLSVIPKYTINTLLDWQVTSKFSANVNWTLYGRQKPREYAEIRTENGVLATNEVGSYSVVGIGGNYQLMKDLRLNAGISNLFDKQIYRENEGASTYNEPKSRLLRWRHDLLLTPRARYRGRILFSQRHFHSSIRLIIFD